MGMCDTVNEEHSKKFLGIGFKFPIQVNPESGRIAMSAYEEDVEEAIRIILSTSVGERVMRPEFGSHAKDFIFQESTLENKAFLEKSISSCLLKFEPRIKDIVVEAELTGSKNEITVKIKYVIRATNNQFNIVYPFYLMEGEG